MYITGKSLIQDIACAAQNIMRQCKQPIAFDEYIATPSFGANVILRFRYAGSAPASPALLNAMETEMREAAGRLYLVNLDGATYKSCGLRFDCLPATLKAIHSRVDCPIPRCAFHRDGLEHDRQTICRLFHLPPDTLLWEMQPKGGELLALALGSGRFAPGQSLPADGLRIHLRFLADDGSHMGMMKATSLAYRQSVSICQILTDFQSPQPSPLETAPGR